MKRYQESFEEDGAHGHGFRLLADAALGDGGGVVLDLGCAAGPLAEQVTGLGHRYVGADIDAAAVDQLRARGFEGHVLDLSLGEDELAAALDAVLDGRAPAAVLLFDVVEHLVDAEPLLACMSRLAQAHPGLQLVVSIPNTTHVDVGIKLLLGRWDMTEIGLLDDTHLRFFSGPVVDATFARAGWVEVDANDVVNAFSDQLFPADAPALRPGAPLRQIMWRVRMGADPYGETYQFVRRYAYDPAATQVEDRAAIDADGCFLTVAVRGTGPDDARLAGLLDDVGRQPAGEIEVLVCHVMDDLDHTDGVDGATDPAAAPDGSPGPLVRTVTVGLDRDWRDAGARAARGRYVAFLDERTRLPDGYVETVQQAVDALPGRVVQVRAATASPREPAGAGGPAHQPVDLDPLDLASRVPWGDVVLDAHAVPRHVCLSNGLRFDPDAADGAASLFLLRAIEMCGIVRPDDCAVVVHPSVPRNLATDLVVLQKHLSLSPLLLPEGAGSQLLALRDDVTRVVPERDGLVEQLGAARQQAETLSRLLRDSDAQLTRERDESRSLRARYEHRLTARLRHRLGRLLRRA